MKTNKTSEAMNKVQDLTPYLTSTSSDSPTPVLDEISDMLGFDAKENPSITFWELFFKKGKFSKKEILDATGLSERWYNMVIDEHYSPGLRTIRTSTVADQTLRRHLERKDLRYHQLLISELFLKVMSFVSLAERIEKELDNENLVDEEFGNEPINLDQCLITVDELEEAMNYYVAHLITTGKISAA